MTAPRSTSRIVDLAHALRFQHRDCRRSFLRQSRTAYCLLGQCFRSIERVLVNEELLTRICLLQLQVICAQSIPQCQNQARSQAPCDLFKPARQRSNNRHVVEDRESAHPGTCHQDESAPAIDSKLCTALIANNADPISRNEEVATHSLAQGRQSHHLVARWTGGWLCQ